MTDHKTDGYKLYEYKLNNKIYKVDKNIFIYFESLFNVNDLVNNIDQLFDLTDKDLSNKFFEFLIEYYSYCLNSSTCSTIVTSDNEKSGKKKITESKDLAEDSFVDPQTYLNVPIEAILSDFDSKLFTKTFPESIESLKELELLDSLLAQISDKENIMLRYKIRHYFNYLSAILYQKHRLNSQGR